MCDPQHLPNLRASKACYAVSITLLFFYYDIKFSLRKMTGITNMNYWNYFMIRYVKNARGICGLEEQQTGRSRNLMET
jgi:hypothetical protein